MQKYARHILLSILIIFLFLLYAKGPIPQDLNYHNFADDRIIFGVPNFWDVMSNLPMFILGLIAMKQSLSNMKIRPGFVAKAIPVSLSIGILGASFGSAYYHLAPDNNTLVWDRLPMTLMFMPLFALLLYDFIGRKFGEWAFYILLPLGIFSIVYWHQTELIGQGDLRPYVFVQFFPMIIVPFILWLYPRKRSYKKDILYILLWYIIAKLAEYFDPQIFEMTGFWSGHTIKHLTAAVALYYVVRLMKAWEKENFIENSTSELNYPAE